MQNNFQLQLRDLLWMTLACASFFAGRTLTSSTLEAEKYELMASLSKLDIEHASLQKKLEYEQSVTSAMSTRLMKPRVAAGRNVIRTYKGTIPMRLLEPAKKIGNVIQNDADWDWARSILFPNINFEENLAIVVVGDDPNTVSPAIQLDNDGTLHVKMWSTLVGYQNPTEASFHVTVLPNKGITRIASIDSSSPKQLVCPVCKVFFAEDQFKNHNCVTKIDIQGPRP